MILLPSPKGVRWNAHIIFTSDLCVWWARREH